MAEYMSLLPALRSGIVRPCRLGIVRLVAAVACVTLAGCRENTGLIVCQLYASPSIVVHVRDSVTGGYIASGATLVLRDGTFVDSVSIPADEPTYNEIGLSTVNSEERAGVYSVTIRRAGYAEWVREGVEVTRDECHVRTVRLTARLDPLA